MIAVILIGGFGKRLRPFTLETPKPLLPVINRPFLNYQFDLLRAHGIREVILATSYRPEVFRRALGRQLSGGPRLRFVNEAKPLGTGGAIKNAQPYLRETVLVLNGDVLNTLDITSFLKFHRRKRADLTIALTRVKDPTLYGVVVTDAEGRIRKFVEKPSWDEVESNTINAGAYIFEPSLLDLIPSGLAYSLERSLFPDLLERGRRVYGYVTAGYWIDIGTVDKYLRVHLDILSGRTPLKLSAQGRRQGLLPGRGVKLGRHLTIPSGDGCRAVLGAGTVVGDFARFSGNVCVGPRCRVGQGATLEDCVVLEGTRIGAGARLERCVVGAGCRIGAQSSLTAQAALAGGSRIEPYSHL